MTFISQHKMIIAALVLVVIGGAWYTLSGSSQSADTLTSTPAVVTGDSDLVNTLLALRAAKLDTPIFSDPAFLQLKDFSTDIVPEPVGRPNPFAPLQSSQPATSSRGAQLFTPKR